MFPASAIYHGITTKLRRASIAKSIFFAACSAGSMNGAAIDARERPVQTHTAAATKPATRKRGRPRTGESRALAKESPISRQQTLAQMLDPVPRACDRGAKGNAQGYKVSGNG